MSRPELHSGKVKNKSVLAELTTRSHRKTDDCQRPPPFKPNVGERSMLDEQLYGSFLLPASLFSKVTLNQFGGGPKAQAVNLTGGFSGNRNHSATLANNYEGHVCELTTVFTVHSLSAKNERIQPSDSEKLYLWFNLRFCWWKISPASTACFITSRAIPTLK